MRAEIIIGLVGAKRSGKTTISEHLVDEYGFQRLRFAEPIKEMLKTMGLTHEQVDGSMKEEPLAILCGKTPRYAMQTLGTEWGRDLIGQDLWVNACQQRLIRASGRRKARIVIDDVRLPNEVRMIKEMGGVIWRVRRPMVEPPRPAWWQVRLFEIGLLRSMRFHNSERYWRDIEADHEVWNTVDTPEDLKGLVDQATATANICRR